jgi:hypothetical protein
VVGSLSGRGHTRTLIGMGHRPARFCRTQCDQSIVCLGMLTRLVNVTVQHPTPRRILNVESTTSPGDVHGRCSRVLDYQAKVHYQSERKDKPWGDTRNVRERANPKGIRDKRSSTAQISVMVGRRVEHVSRKAEHLSSHFACSAMVRCGQCAARLFRPESADSES